MTSSIAEKNDDLELLRRFAEQGDRAALGALFSRYADPAYRFALRLCGRSADAEDAIQSAFLEICRHAANFRGDSSVKTWILGFVLNACRSKAREETRRRSRQERAATAKESAAAGGDAIDQETADQVREAVEELPEHYRSPVWLHYAEGLSPAEVGAVLNLPADTVRKQQLGLMHRKSMPADHGMIFVFPDERERSFWMKNTLIPLDMIFISADREIVGIVANAEPETLTGRGVPVPSQFVLEIGGGLAAQRGILAGQRVEFRGVDGF